MSFNRLQSHFFPLVLVFCAFTFGCSPKYEKQVVISCDEKQTYASPILASFTRLFPKDEFQLARRSMQPGDQHYSVRNNDLTPAMNPDGDVVWDSDLLRTLNRQRQGFLQPRSWTIPRDWPSSFRASDETWVAFAARARVLLINHQTIDPAAQPRSIFDLGAPEWKDKCGIASLSSPSVRAHLAIIASHNKFIKLDTNKDLAIATEKQTLDFEKWIVRLSQNAKIYEDEIQVASAVARGDIHWAIVDSDVGIRIRDQTPSIKIEFPDQTSEGFGTVLIPDTVSVSSNAKNPKVAGRLADFLVSDEVEARLTISDSATIPLNPTPKELSRLLKGADVKWARINFNNLPDAWENAITIVQANLRVNQSD